MTDERLPTRGAMEAEIERRGSLLREVRAVIEATPFSEMPYLEDENYEDRVNRLTSLIKRIDEALNPPLMSDDT